MISVDLGIRKQRSVSVYDNVLKNKHYAGTSIIQAAFDLHTTYVHVIHIEQ